MIDSSQYVMPVLAMSSIENASYPEYLGSCFFVGSSDRLVTCRHVLESVKPGSRICVQYPDGSLHPISNAWFHPSLDIAVANVRNFGAKAMRPLGTPLTLGSDVSAFAYLKDILHGKPAILPSLVKGYIVNAPYARSEVESGMGTYTLSFPSLSGFSGSPVIVFNTDIFVGMLFNNKQSDVTVFSHEEVDDGGSVWRERVSRITEHGLMIGYGDIMNSVLLFSDEAQFS